MKVVIGKRVWKMSKQEYEKTLEVAKEQVPFGVYAIEKKDYAELCNQKCTSVTQLKMLIRQLKKQGYKVHYNGV